MDLAQAMGVASLTDLCPSMVTKRISADTVMTYEELYPRFQAGELLSEHGLVGILLIAFNCRWRVRARWFLLHTSKYLPLTIGTFVFFVPVCFCCLLTCHRLTMLWSGRASMTSWVCSTSGTLYDTIRPTPTAFLAEHELCWQYCLARCCPGGHIWHAGMVYIPVHWYQKRQYCHGLQSSGNTGTRVAMLPVAKTNIDIHSKFFFSTKYLLLPNLIGWHIVSVQKWTHHMNWKRKMIYLVLFCTGLSHPCCLLGNYGHMAC